MTQKGKKSSTLKGRIASSFKSKAFRSGSYSLAAGAIVIALAVIINLIVAALPQKLTLIDTTESGIFTMSQQTEQIVGALNEDVTLVWVVSDANENVYLQRLLDNYEELSQHIDVIKIDPVTSPVRLKELAGDDIDTQALEDNSVIVKSARTEKLLNYRYDIFTYSDYAAYYQYYYYTGYEMLDSFCAERSITSAIGYVTSDDLPVMYMLSGHGEEDLSMFYSQIETENIRVETLSLATTGAVPEDCACLMIASPLRDITAAERTQIEDYVNRGGHILLLTTYVSNDAMPNLLGMMADNYGVAINDGIVIEGDASNYYVGFPDLLIPPMVSHEITDPIINAGFNVMLPSAQGLTIADTLPDGVTVSPLMTTSDKSYIQTEPDEHVTDETAQAEPDRSRFTLGAAITDAGSGEEPGQIVWISSIYLLDSMTNEMSSGANMDLFLNSISWLCDHEESVSVREVTMSEEYLTMSQSAATVFTVVFIAVVPALFVIEGIITVVRRRRGK